MRVDVLDRNERFVNGLAMSAAVMDVPGRGAGGRALEQMALRRYRGVFEVAGPGSV